MIDKEILEQFQMLTGVMEKMESRMANKVEELESRMITKEDIEPLTDRSASKVGALMEEKLGKRIDSLFGGYKLTYEKQYELELEFVRATTEMQSQIDNLQARIASLEKKIAG